MNARPHYNTDNSDDVAAARAAHDLLAAVARPLSPLSLQGFHDFQLVDLAADGKSKMTP